MNITETNNKRLTTLAYINKTNLENNISFYLQKSQEIASEIYW